MLWIHTMSCYIDHIFSLPKTSNTSAYSHTMCESYQCLHDITDKSEIKIVIEKHILSDNVEGISVDEDCQTSAVPQITDESYSELHSNTSVNQEAGVYSNTSVNQEAEVYSNAFIKEAELNSSTPANEEAELNSNTPVNEKAELHSDTLVNEEAELNSNTLVNEEVEFYSNSPVNEEAELNSNSPVNEEAELNSNTSVNKEAELNAYVNEEAKLNSDISDKEFGDSTVNQNNVVIKEAKHVLLDLKVLIPRIPEDLLKLYNNYSNAEIISNVDHSEIYFNQISSSAKNAKEVPDTFEKIKDEKNLNISRPLQDSSSEKSSGRERELSTLSIASKPFKNNFSEKEEDLVSVDSDEAVIKKHELTHGDMLFNKIPCIYIERLDLKSKARSASKTFDVNLSHNDLSLSKNALSERLSSSVCTLNKSNLNRLDLKSKVDSVSKTFDVNPSQKDLSPSKGVTTKRLISSANSLCEQNDSNNLALFNEDISLANNLDSKLLNLLVGHTSATYTDKAVANTDSCKTVTNTDNCKAVANTDISKAVTNTDNCKVVANTDISKVVTNNDSYSYCATSSDFNSVLSMPRENSTDISHKKISIKNQSIKSSKKSSFNNKYMEFDFSKIPCVHLERLPLPILEVNINFTESPEQHVKKPITSSSNSILRNLLISSSSQSVSSTEICLKRKIQNLKGKKNDQPQLNKKCKNEKDINHIRKNLSSNNQISRIFKKIKKYKRKIKLKKRENHNNNSPSLYLANSCKSTNLNSDSDDNLPLILFAGLNENPLIPQAKTKSLKKKSNKPKKSNSTHNAKKIFPSLKKNSLIPQAKTKSLKKRLNKPKKKSTINAKNYSSLTKNPLIPQTETKSLKKKLNKSKNSTINAKNYSPSVAENPLSPQAKIKSLKKKLNKLKKSNAKNYFQSLTESPLIPRAKTKSLKKKLNKPPQKNSTIKAKNYFPSVTKNSKDIQILFDNMSKSHSHVPISLLKKIIELEHSYNAPSSKNHNKSRKRNKKSCLQSKQLSKFGEVLNKAKDKSKSKEKFKKGFSNLKKKKITKQILMKKQARVYKMLTRYLKKEINSTKHKEKSNRKKKDKTCSGEKLDSGNILLSHIKEEPENVRHIADNAIEHPNVSSQNENSVSKVMESSKINAANSSELSQNETVSPENKSKKTALDKYRLGFLTKKSSLRFYNKFLASERFFISKCKLKKKKKKELKKMFKMLKLIGCNSDL